MSKPKLIYNDIPIPQFMDVLSIENPLLPNFEYENDKIVFKDREIKVKCAFNKRGQMSLENQKELIAFLNSSKFSYGKLYLYNDLNNFYMARIKSNGNITGDKRGEIELIFHCKPYKLSKNEFNVTSNVVTYNGDVDVYPTLEIRVTSECTKIIIEMENEEYNGPIEINGNFNSNDVIVVNQANNLITVNDNIRMGIWSVKSKRHKLVKGTTLYTIKSGNIDLIIKYNELNY